MLLKKIATILAAWLFSTMPVEASLLVDPSVGTVTVLFSDSTEHDDEVAEGRNLGFTGEFFGDTMFSTTVDVSTNGDLNFSGNSDYVPEPLPGSIAFIAPFWTDLVISEGGGGSIIESLDSMNRYYAITYQNVQPCCDDPEETTRLNCQVVWFGADMTIGNTDFKTGDIVFSYGTISNFQNFESPVVGLNLGDYTSYASLPDTIHGSVEDPAPFGATFILFRPDGENNYFVYIASLNGAAIANSDLYQTELSSFLSWTVPTFFEPVHFNVYRNGSLLAVLEPTESSFSDHYRKEGETYTYEVVAINSMDDTMTIGTSIVQFD
jgi:hypothetical protein